MKVLMDVGYPLGWAPGGLTVQIKGTIKGLKALGVEIEWLHYENEELSPADIIHFWSRPQLSTVYYAKLHGCRAVLSTQRSIPKQPSEFEKWCRKLAVRYLPRPLRFSDLGLFGLEHLDAFIVLNDTDRKYYLDVWGFGEDRVFTVPNGVSEEFFDETLEPIPFAGLVNVGYITRVKNSVEAAKAAKAARVPIKFIGGPRVEGPEYLDAFRGLVDNTYVFWEGEIKSKALVARHIRGARGLILPSKHEAQPMVILEALACRKPVMASHLENLRNHYGESIWYCVQPDQAAFVDQLRSFYEQGETLQKPNFKVPSVEDMAKQTFEVYERVLNQS